MFDRILIPLDGSSRAERVIDSVTGFLGPEAQLTLLVVVDMSGAIVEATVPATCSVPKAKAYVHELANRVRAHGVGVNAEVRFGQPVEEILLAARDRGIGLIAMSTHGRTGVGRLLRGSVAEAVLRAAEVPLLLVRRARPAERPARGAGTSLLVPLDGSAEAESVLPVVASVARRRGLTVELLQVVEAAPSAAMLSEETFRGLELDARAYTEEVRQKLRREGIPAVARVVRGVPAHCIIDRAHSEEIGLVAMCTHGYTGMTRLLFGSVAETVLRSIEVPLLAVRMKPIAALTHT